MNKNLRKAIIPTLSLLLIGIMALTGATYAWFTTGNTGAVEAFDVNVEAADGLLVSADNANWKSTVTLSELAAQSGNVIGSYTNTTYNPVTLSPVSTDGTVTGGAVNFYKATVKDNNITASTAVTDNAGLMKFDLYFQNAGATVKKVKLTNSAVFNGADASAAQSSSEAIRIGFVTQGSASIGSAISGTGTASKIYEPNAAKHTVTGLADAKANLTKLNALQTTQLTDNNIASTKFAYLGLAAEGTDLSLDRYTAVSGKLAAVTTYDETGEYIELPANQTTKVTVYVWLEGQDADCLNEIAGNALKINLQFEGVAQTATE